MDQVERRRAPQVAPRPDHLQVGSDAPERLDHSRLCGREQQLEVEAPVQTHDDVVGVEIAGEPGNCVAPPASATSALDQRPGGRDRRGSAREHGDSGDGGDGGGPAPHAAAVGLAHQLCRHQQVDERCEIQHVMCSCGTGQGKHRYSDACGRNGYGAASVRQGRSVVSRRLDTAGHERDDCRDPEQRDGPIDARHRLVAAPDRHQPVWVRTVQCRQQCVHTFGEIAAVGQLAHASEHPARVEEHGQGAHAQQSRRSGELTASAVPDIAECRTVEQRQAEQGRRADQHEVGAVVDAETEREAAGEGRAASFERISAQQQGGPDRAAQPAGREGSPLPLCVEEDRRVGSDEGCAEQGDAQVEDAPGGEHGREQRSERDRQRGEPNRGEFVAEQRKRRDQELALERAEVRQREQRKRAAQQPGLLRAGGHQPLPQRLHERPTLLGQPCLVVEHAGASCRECEADPRGRDGEPAEHEYRELVLAQPAVHPGTLRPHRPLPARSPKRSTRARSGQLEVSEGYPFEARGA